jgi:hypothetical protein
MSKRVIFRRQKEIEQKLMETEVTRRVNEYIENSFNEELERRKFEIEAEVQKRVDFIKNIIEKQMKEDFEKRIQEEVKRLKDKEVCLRHTNMCWSFFYILLQTTKQFCLIT